MESDFARQEGLRWVAESNEQLALAEDHVRRAKFAQDQASKFFELAGVQAPHLHLVAPPPDTDL